MIRRQEKGLVRRLSCEEFEARLCLSAIAFASHDVIVSEANGAHAVVAADFDGDGDLDVLAGAWWGGTIAWYENTDDKGAFVPHQLIATETHDPVSSVCAADMDGDGDIDVLSASSGEVAWYENTDSLGSFGQPQRIGSQAGSFVQAADFDGDGDMDVLSGRGWYENTDGNGSFGPQQVITTRYAESVYAADLDGDEDTDVLCFAVSRSSISRLHGRDYDLAWYENTDGQGRFGPQQVISTEADAASSVYAADLDNDGDIDVLSVSRGDNNIAKIAWYENTDGQGTFGPQQVISTEVDSARSLYAADLDGDGDMDVLSASAGDDKIAWYENIDGDGRFGTQQVITTRAHRPMSVHAADVDGDGDVDVLSASSYDDKIAWYENDGTGTFGQQQLITAPPAADAIAYAADLDGDGDMDVLSASSGDDTIAWQENTDGRGTFGKRHVIATDAFGPTWVSAADLDGDGDMDVLSVSYWDDIIAWYENTDGRGNFGPQSVITTQSNLDPSWYSPLHAVDLDDDDDVDVLLPLSVWDAATRTLHGSIAWYENTDGQGSFAEQRVISTEAEWAAYSDMSLCAADLDGDGDMDVLSAPRGDNPIAWYENTDGKGNFGPQQVITREADEASSVHAADVDGDGDMDVLSVSRGDSYVAKIAWYENTDGQGRFGPQQVIPTHAVSPDNPFRAGRWWWGISVHPADVDSDGDIDVLSTGPLNEWGRNTMLVWHENTDGKGTFGPPQLIATEDAPLVRSLCAADMDGDGDMDFVLATGSFMLYGRVDKVAWYEQYRSSAGDANRDRQFDQQDIVQVLEASKYLTGEPATWEQGDWNEDGVFDQEDVVAALATGNYLQGPYVDAALADSGE